jgi:ADP-heptose:LPS heptosyltransferase
MSEQYSSSQLTDSTNEGSWINPIGGMGDMLMVAGVLKQVFDQDHKRRFNLVRRSAYRKIFLGHPAIREIGFPPQGVRIIGTDYWRYELNRDVSRPYQILARVFGLPTPIEESLFFPGPIVIDPLLEQKIPFGKRNVIIATNSDSQRKMMATNRWEKLVAQLAIDGFFVIQTGRLYDNRVKHAYSLLGLTSIGELIAIIRRADLVITVDTLAMHVARLTKTPAIVLWGPTDPAIYGYPGQRNLLAAPLCNEWSECLSARTPKNYGKPCPYGDNQCLNRIPLEEIRAAVHQATR